MHASVLLLLSPEQMEVAKPARKLEKELGHILPAPKTSPGEVRTMKKPQFEKLQLLCWSRRRKTHSESENRGDIVH